MWLAGWSEPAVKEVVDVWQEPQSPPVGWGAAGRVTIVTPKKLFPAS
jgi:hypothetical protein